MDNHGKTWTPGMDQKIFDKPEASDAALALELFRSEKAIYFRRAYLAAKMHMQRPEVSVDDCALMLLADQAQARQYVEQWRTRTTTLDRLALNRKRSAQEQLEEEPPRTGLREQNRHPKPNPFNSSAYSTQDWSEDHMINMICKTIQEEEGHLSHLWNDPSMLSTLIKYYPGFRAYAESIRGL